MMITIPDELFYKLKAGGLIEDIEMRQHEGYVSLTGKFRLNQECVFELKTEYPVDGNL